MRKKLLFAAVFALASYGSLWAQPRIAGAPQLLVKQEAHMMSPVWSPDGTKLAMTSDNYQGIWVVNADGSHLRKITADEGAGYKLAWGADNNTILGRTNIRENHRVFHEVKTYDVATGTEKLLVAKTRMLKGLPCWADNQVSYQIDTERKLADAGIKAVSGKAGVAQNVNLLNRMIESPASVAQEVSGLKMFKGHIIFNPVLSPSGDKIVFQVSGKGLYVCNINGEQVKSLGQGSRASWMPDGKYVLATVVTDNGEVLTSGKLYAIDVNTAQSYHLPVDTNLIVQSPCVSVDGKKVAFEDAATGYIYVANLK